MYLIEKGTELTPKILGQILQKFQTTELPQLTKYWNYYQGKQKIITKTSADETKQYNKIVTNFTKYITDTYLGYLDGIPISYFNEKFDEIINILKWNDYKTEDNEFLRQALIFGRAFEICYIDEEGNIRFRTLDSRNCIPVYDNTLNNDLQYVIRFWKEELDADNVDRYMVEVYGPESIKRYHSGAGFASFSFINEDIHYFNQCPVTVFKLNEDETSIFDSVITLQDGYNEVISGSVDDFDAFCDAYLVLKGVKADEEDLAAMKRNRVLMLDTDCAAEYLTKTINDSQTLNVLMNFKDNIHKISNCPDFTDEKFMAQSGIALRYKLVGFENVAANIEQNMHKALQRRIELIAGILELKGTEEATWRDVEITFTRNLPLETEGIVAMVNSLRGLVSTRTLLSQLPFITDVDAEIEMVKAENEANMALYSFNSVEENE